jgi:hypothetical protein
MENCGFKKYLDRPAIPGLEP